MDMNESEYTVEDVVGLVQDAGLDAEQLQELYEGIEKWLAKQRRPAQEDVIESKAKVVDDTAETE